MTAYLIGVGAAAFFSLLLVAFMYAEYRNKMKYFDLQSIVFFLFALSLSWVGAFVLVLTLFGLFYLEWKK